MFNKTPPTGAKPATTPAAASPKSKYDGLASTQVTQRGNYLAPGHYLLRVNSFRKQVGFRAGPMFVANQTVIHRFPDSPDGATTAGTEVSDVLKESNVAFMARMRAFIDAAGALTQADWDEQGGETIVNEASGDGQPLANAVVEARCTIVVKQTAVNKPQSELVSSDTYTRVDYLRRLPFAEVKSVLGANATTFIPDIDRLIAEEAA